MPDFIQAVRQTVTQAVERTSKTVDAYLKEDDPAGFSDITPEQARQEMQDNPDAVILDVRSAREYESGHVSGAVHIDMDDILDGLAMDRLPPRDKTVLVYCRSGRRSGIVGRWLAMAGWKDVRNFQGVMQWPYGLER